MARFAPFETHPHIALAVSGGADSMALAVLGRDWAEAAGGSARAYIVDHGLRRESAQEAAEVAGRCRAMGLQTDILVWKGVKPARGIQEAARHARYDLLARACTDARLLHLLVAHHLDDQMETVALRKERGSGPEGLAGMTALAEWRDLRLLRPLIDVPKARLVATARARGLAWVEDPSNVDPAFARGRLRRSTTVLPAPAAVHAYQQQRLAMEARRAHDLAACVTIDQAGFAVLDREIWRKLPSEQRSEAISRLATTIGGLRYPPRRDRLKRVVACLEGDAVVRPLTLGRCLWRGKGASVLVGRENRHLPGPMTLEAGRTHHWDGRFRVSAPVSGLTIAPLGTADWRRLKESGMVRAMPPGTAPVLPAFHDLEGLVAVPHLHFTRSGAGGGHATAEFAPHHALAQAGFVASAGADPVAEGDAY